MRNSTAVSPRGAIIIGLVGVAMGVMVVLLALGGNAALDAPRWVVTLVGLSFVLGGAAVILGSGWPARQRMASFRLVRRWRRA